jgi:hypothetical protein
MVRMYATIAGPPNAVSPSRRKRKKIIKSVGVIRLTPGDEEVIYERRMKMCAKSS